MGDQGLLAEAYCAWALGYASSLQGRFLRSGWSCCMERRGSGGGCAGAACGG